MKDSIYVALDRSRLRVYREEIPLSPVEGREALKVVGSVDYPDGRTGYVGNETDVAGAFPPSGGHGHSIDERLPLKEEHERRLATQLATSLEPVLQAYPHDTWHLAAGPGLLQPVLGRLSPSVRERLGRALEKNLAQLPAHELRGHFA